MTFCFQISSLVLHNRQAKVSDYLIRHGESTQWIPVFRSFSKAGESHFFSLMDIINQIQISSQGSDSRVWAASLDGLFSVASSSLSLAHCSPLLNPIFSIWKFNAPLHVIAFVRLALRGSIFTTYDMQKREMVILNACPLCLEAEEIVDHILLNCKIARRLWYLVLLLFDCCWVLPSISAIF